MSQLIFILIFISLLSIFLYEYYFKHYFVEGNTNRESKNDCNEQQVNRALKQEGDIDNLDSNIQRFETKLDLLTKQLTKNEESLRKNEDKYNMIKKRYPEDLNNQSSSLE